MVSLGVSFSFDCFSGSDVSFCSDSSFTGSGRVIVVFGPSVMPVVFIDSCVVFSLLRFFSALKFAITKFIRVSVCPIDFVHRSRMPASRIIFLISGATHSSMPRGAGIKRTFTEPTFPCVLNGIECAPLHSHSHEPQPRLIGMILSFACVVAFVIALSASFPVA